MDSPGMVYLKKKNELVEASEVDLHKLTLYKDYVFLPYIRDSEIYDSFLDHYHLDKEKRCCIKAIILKSNFDILLTIIKNMITYFMITISIMQKII